MEIRIGGRADMDHRGYVQFDQFLIQWIPPAVGQWRVAPMTAGRIGVEIDRDKSVSFHATLELGDAIVRLDAGRLRQLADADEIVRIEPGYAMDQLVGDLRPFRAGL